MCEIVGAMINGGTITNNLLKIIEAAKAGRINAVYTRQQMKFMSDCDLGINWERMASGPTLLVIDDAGNVQWPTTEQDNEK